jgi:tRNA-2-methylthio-N6-dimethylallyladenosine synthase
MTYFFETYGCQMNIAESASVEQLLIARGWTKADSAEIADLAVINTCSVRATAENRIFGRLGWYSGLKAVRSCEPGAKCRSLVKAAEYVRTGPKPITLVVMGCMAERLLTSLKSDYPVVDYVLGTFAKQHFGDIITAVENHNTAAQPDDSPSYVFAPLSYEPGAFTAYVPIMHGCNNFCTYCIVPYVRGREISRPVNEILAELDMLSSYGVHEVTLLGQNVNSYQGTDGMQQVNFAGLLSRIARHLKRTSSPVGWVRFMSSHPKDLSEDVISVIAEESVLCHHIHLPVQNGSNRILSAMNRRYDRESYLALVNRIRTAVPDVSLTTDIMVGFPGETERDVTETLSLMEAVRYENAFMYYYNPRGGTPACTMPEQIPQDEKKARLQRVIDLQLKITQERMTERIGCTVQVLVENISRDCKQELLGKTEQNERIVFAADKSLIGTFTKVRLDSLNGETFKGILLK